jgi:tetratricopeptide (TPR) repeat protein
MIVREDDENLKLVLNSIQGLYDELVIGVDSRPESDNVYKLIQSYPNTVAFRQEWPGRFDAARQDVLNRVSPKATYIGCCDSDEVLVSPSPIEIRKFLYESQPKAVNIAIKYTEDVGPNFKGASYLRTKIWSASHPRGWIGWIHEYPGCKAEYNIPTPARHIIFEHLKVDHKKYRSDLIINSMLQDINNGLFRWYPYLAQEYRAVKNYDEAMKCCIIYITREDAEDQHIKVALEEYLYNLGITTPTKWACFLENIMSLIEKNPFLNDKAVVCEYIAIAHFYNGDKEAGKIWHGKALNLLKKDSRDHIFITNNDKFFN